MIRGSSTLAAIAALSAMGLAPSADAFALPGGASIASSSSSVSTARGLSALARPLGPVVGAPLLRPDLAKRNPRALRMAEETPSESSEEVVEEAEAAAAPEEEEEVVEDPFAGLDLGSKEFLQRKVEILEKELADAQVRVGGLEADTKTLDDLVARNILKTASAAELKDTYVRLAADFDNFRRRSATDLTNAKNMALTGVLKDLTTVLDNFDLAKANVKVETDKEISIKKSYDAVGSQLTNAITKMGVEPIKPLGEKFDPMFHEAIQQAESTEYAEGYVMQALQTGYKVGSQTIRAALVIVSAGPGPEGGAAPPAEEAASEAEEKPAEE